MTSHSRDPMTRPPAPPRCAECGKRSASLRLNLYPDHPKLVTEPICNLCATRLALEYPTAIRVSL